MTAVASRVLACTGSDGADGRSARAHAKVLSGASGDASKEPWAVPEQREEPDAGPTGSSLDDPSVVTPEPAENVKTFWLGEGQVERSDNGS